ncbi:MAG: hypothetical protein ABUK01_11585 [Leptospirales bacterium]
MRKNIGPYRLYPLKELFFKFAPFVISRFYAKSAFDDLHMFTFFFLPTEIYFECIHNLDRDPENESNTPAKEPVIATGISGMFDTNLIFYSQGRLEYEKAPDVMKPYNSFVEVVRKAKDCDLSDLDDDLDVLDGCDYRHMLYGPRLDLDYTWCNPDKTHHVFQSNVLFAYRKLLEKALFSNPHPRWNEF